MDKLEEINSILDEFQPSFLYCLELRNQLISEAILADVPDRVSDMESDQSLLMTLDHDLNRYQTYLSAVEFNWIEAATKELFIANALLTHDAPLTTEADIQRLSQINAECEKVLQDLNRSIVCDEEVVLGMTQELEDGYDLAIKASNQGRKLTNEIADLELELNELKINQTEDDAERMTIAEVTQASAECEKELQTMTERLALNQAEVPRLKALHIKESKLVDQLRITRNTMEKAEGDRRRTLVSQTRGGTLVRIESSRNWLKSARRTYLSAMGIKFIKVGGPDQRKPDELHLRFLLRHPLEGSLVIKFEEFDSFGSRRITSAYLAQSSQDIESIVKPFAVTGDLISLVHIVLHFLNHL